ncbi:ornithine-acyl-ACP acyltransferase [Rhodobacterales bacterium 59_46_T64]|nr:ornithine-acyl-ACP acyltransferase [Rhodobacterales bacterium 59_46_T64]
MRAETPQLQVKLAETEDELRAAQRLRYHVFVEELGGGGEMVDHTARLERDRFDPYFDHLILIDPTRDAENLDHVVGVYRLLRAEQAESAGQYYSEDEYDISVLKNSGRKLLELGRSCVHPDFRGGMALFKLWSGLADFILANEIDILFGVASFHGTDVAALAPALSQLHHRHLAPESLRVRAQPAHFQRMDLIPEDELDRAATMRMVPPLIKSYLRLGGYIGEGAFIDHAFNTVDVCLVVDMDHLTDKKKSLYSKDAGK